MEGKRARDPLPVFELGQLVSNRYRIAGGLGRGGMARVYLAEDLKLGGRLLALKLTRTYDDAERFIDEARLLSALRHPGLPEIVDYEPPDDQGLALIVMTYVEGETLAERMRRHGMRLPFAKALRYLLQLARTLQYLHAQRPLVVFRDLKPANVMIDGRDDAILIDFGIAREFKPGADKDTLMLGTPAFAAPEQLRGEQSDARTDLYGLGALAYYLLTGGGFYDRTGAVGRPNWQRDVPPGFVASVEQLLSERPEARPDGAAAVVRDWQRFAASFEAHESGRALAMPTDRPAQASRNAADRPPGQAVRIAAILSAYPGVGATFVARLLSSRLNRLGVAHALTECPGVEPELYRWLDGERRMPGRAVFADPSGAASVSPAWREGHADYYPLRPDDPPGSAPAPGFAFWLDAIGAPLVLLDVSGAWQDARVSDWLAAHADAIFPVADPLPVKWTARRQRSCAELLTAASRAGASTGWIANRDMDFSGRGEWLSLFPERPRLAVPHLPPAEAAAWLWQGGDIALPRRAAAEADDFCARLLG
ncbi:serine/threonine-protein kinase [Cohnella hashimotonis]|uniref:Serine/threonine-protein kinase n=1 Tax=Cohnella hashimotonis TaxID=2826895 RepID=A0ABT6TI51_9BACL|nr:serine/threonine-protein kinase [Cohnella hashimotonis]MDI4645639.1 serine/threonine-protein kinase [Cohnella hashimotonis]